MTIAEALSVLIAALSLIALGYAIGVASERGDE